MENRKPTLTREYVNENLQISLSQEQYDKLAILDLISSPIRVYEILQILKELKII